MGMFLTKQAGSKGRIGIWHITESVEELLKMKAFSKEDLSMLNSFSYEHRKKEWLVARIIVEKLLDENTEMIYDEYSKPILSAKTDGLRLSAEKNSRKHISLSHSHELLAVIIDDSETGIDIEQIKPNVLKIKDKFMSKDELKAIEKEFKLEELTLYWCVKESLYKLYGKKKLTFKENLFVEPFEYLGKGNIRGEIILDSAKTKYILHYEKISVAGKDYMMTFVVNED